MTKNLHTPIPAPENHELLGKTFRFVQGSALRVVRTGAGPDDIVRLKGQPGSYELPARMVWLLIYEGLLEEV